MVAVSPLPLPLPLVTTVSLLTHRKCPAVLTRFAAYRKKAARILSQAKMKETALQKKIEARYTEAKACVASDSLDVSTSRVL